MRKVGVLWYHYFSTTLQRPLFSKPKVVYGWKSVTYIWFSYLHLLICMDWWRYTSTGLVVVRTECPIAISGSSRKTVCTIESTWSPRSGIFAYFYYLKQRDIVQCLFSICTSLVGIQYIQISFFMIIFMKFCKAASKCLYINTMSQPVAVSVCVLIANNVVSRNVLFSWTNFSP